MAARGSAASVPAGVIERPRTRQRLEFLDSLRGLAALLVVLHHAYQTAPFWPQLVRFSPLRVLLTGRSSVIFFFVLSGFVLSYGLLRSRRPIGGVEFAAKRLIRIFGPYVIAGALALLAMALLKPTPLANAGIAFNDMWVPTIGLWDILGHFLLSGSAAANGLNIPSWSLVYELRISIVIPVLCILLVRYSTAFLVTTAVGFVFIELLLSSIGLGLVPYAADDLGGNVLVTLHFTAFFILGMMIARALIRDDAWLHCCTKGQKLALLGIGLLLMMVTRDVAMALGSAIILAVCLVTPRVQRWLDRPGLVFLGKISFSLYLTHMIVLETVVRGLDGTLPIRLSVALALCIVVPAACLFHAVIEQPCHAIARRLSLGAPLEAPLSDPSTEVGRLACSATLSKQGESC